MTNNSYFADPWLFNCKNDPEQRAIWKAERRAINFAQKTGVRRRGRRATRPTTSPTRRRTPPAPTTRRRSLREITNACAVVPVEVPGVVGVTADGNLQLKSFYSSYGVGAARRRRPGRRLDPPADGRRAERPRALDLAGRRC